jgi:hypothetical protein
MIAALQVFYDGCRVVALGIDKGRPGSPPVDTEPHVRKTA